MYSLIQNILHCCFIDDTHKARFLWACRGQQSCEAAVSVTVFCKVSLFVFSALCEGERACMQDEACVYPGLCRCKPGFYGYQCKTRE